MAFDEDCDKCGYFRGHPNTRVNGRLFFLCSRCKNKQDVKAYIAEAKVGA